MKLTSAQNNQLKPNKSNISKCSSHLETPISTNVSKQVSTNSSFKSLNADVASIGSHLCLLKALRDQLGVLETTNIKPKSINLYSSAPPYSLT